MTNEMKRRAEDCLPYRYRAAYVHVSLVGRVTPCAPPRVLRSSDFSILSFNVPNWCEARDWLADPRELSCCDNFINVLVSRAGFLCEASP